MQRFSFKEITKSIILVVLFFTTILLLYLNWTQSGSKFSIADIIPIEIRKAEYVSENQILRPSRIIISDESSKSFSEFNGNSVTVFDTAKAEVKKLLGSSGVIVTEITKEQYDAAMGEFGSVQLYFDCSIPFGSFCEHVGDRAPASSDIADDFYILAFSEADNLSFFIRSEGGCFRIISDVETGAVNTIKSLVTGKETIMYPASEILGGASDVYIPINMEINYYEGAASPYIAAGEEIAETVFGDTFDFVRKISDTFGNVTYMYSYGAKRLTVSADGRLEFKEDTTAGTSNGFYADLETAIAFLSSTDSFAAGDLRLYKVEELRSMQANRIRGYRFTFIQPAGDLGVASEDPAAVIEVLGGKIAYATRRLLFLSYAQGDGYLAYDASNMIAENSSSIYERLTNERADSADAAFRYVADRIEDLYPCYLEKEGRLLPVWILKVDGKAFAFNMLTGDSYGLV